MSRTSWLRVGVVVVLLVPFLAEPVAAQSGVVGRGRRVFDSRWNEETCTRVRAAANNTLALTADGRVLVWGDNAHGQCLVPELPPGVRYVDAAVGRTFGVALRSDGQEVAWGEDDGGEMPTLPGREADAAIAMGAGLERVPPLPQGLTYTCIVAGERHALALRSDGACVAWGDDAEQQCEVPPLPQGLHFVSIAAGASHSVALRSDGRVVCWGSNRDGQCNALVLPPGVHYVQASVNENGDIWYGGGLGPAYAALRSDGWIDVWGSAGNGSVPALPAGLRYEQVSVGMRHLAALRSDGNIVAWGLNDYGSCNVTAPPAGRRYVEVLATGELHREYCFISEMFDWYAATYARLDDGSLRSWGACEWGQCSLSSTMAAVQLASCGTSLCIRRADGSIDIHGALSSSFPTPPAGVEYVEVSASGATYWETHCNQYDGGDSIRLLARRSDGSVVSYYGANDTPTLPAGLAYVQIACGIYHSLARRSDGSVVAWGNNSFGQCNIPAPPAGSVYVAIAASAYESLALYDSVPARGSVAQVCSAGANSVSSAGATLEARGAASVSVNDLALHVTQLPPHAIGQFVYGSGLQYAPFGNGHLCIGGSVQRVLPLQLSSASGAVDFAVDLAQYPFSGSPNAIQPSSAWNFQYWYRDPTSSGPSTFDTSGALHIVFAP